MHYIERVEVDGFWGKRNIRLDLYKDVNFIIGENGTGKTNLINMVAATLNADFAMLDRLPFSRISLHLKQRGGRKKPKIEVFKQDKKSSPFPNIEFRIQESATGEVRIFSLNEVEEDRSLRSSYNLRQHYIKRYTADILDQLEKLSKTTWLSVHRVGPARNPNEDRSFESTVDRKLNELQEKLIRLFSKFQARASEETNKFQEYVFLSLLYEDNRTSVINSVKNLDLENEEQTLVEIFKKFRISENRFAGRINRHFANLRKMDDNPKTWAEVYSLINMWRIHSVVQEWQAHSGRQSSIFGPQTNFLARLNHMLGGRKIVKLNEKNELIVSNGYEDEMSIYDLSSGEKQLIILLAEAVLQEQSPWIYIADEPELSLHVSWQEALIPNIVNINRNAQVICATHSPDIVGSYGNRIIDMKAVFI